MLTGKGVDDQLMKQRREAEERDAQRRAELQKLPYLDLVSGHAPAEIEALALVREEDARKALLVPLKKISKQLVVAAVNPSAPEAVALLDALKKKYVVEVFVSSRSGISHMLHYYQYVTDASKEISGRVEIDAGHLSEVKKSVVTLRSLTELLASSKTLLTSEILEIILAGSMALRASDIHLEPSSTTGVLRLRIDGLLHTAYDQLPPAVYHSIIMRIKLLSNLKLNVSREAQDGRFTISLENRDIEVRTSVIPSEFGETVVLRILDPNALTVNLEELGWRDDDLAIVKSEIAKPNGLILNTGPTGSGKTTTLYAFLKYTFRPEIKIITIEDPIEYHLEGISQTQVNTDVGYTFASGLRSILRQDPNIILVGEIRDQETAEIAMNAALTGHIVFSTLHTNDAVGAVPRLLDLGAKPQTLGPALSLVIAQRLIRRLCVKCKKPVATDEKTGALIASFLESLPKRVSREPYRTPTLFGPVGCEVCGGIGYHGRTSIFELFQVTETIEQSIYKNPTEIELKSLANTQGMTTMQEDGILKSLLGITSLAEVERLTGSLSWKRV